MPELASRSPQAVTAEAGEARWWGAGLAVLKLRAADSGGAAIIEVAEPPGYAAPLHVHHREDEAFWILEGGATFEIGDAVVEARAGDCLFGPRDIPHRYTVGPEGCRMLFVVTPGAGFEALLLELSRPAVTRTLPPDSGAPTEEQIARMQEAIRSHGCEILG